MRNLPEEDVFTELKERLQNYTEDPDNDSWDKIAGAIPHQKSFWESAWVDRSTVAIMLSLLLYFSVSSVNDRENIGTEKEFPVSSSQPSNVKSPATLQPIPLKHKNVLPPSSLLTGAHTSENTSLKAEFIRKNQTKHFSEKIIRDASLSQNHPVNSTIASNNADRIKNDSMLVNREPNYFTSREQTEELGGDRQLQIQNDQTTIGTITTVNAEHDPKKVLDSDDRIPVDSLYKMKNKKQHSETSNHEKKFHSAFYTSLTPSLTYQKIVPFLNDDISIDGIKPVGVFDAGRIGISIDAGYQRRVSKKLEVYAGVLYYQQNQRITYTYQTSDQVDVASSGSDLVFSIAPSSQEKNILYSMKNIGASVGALYLIRDGRLQHKAGFGLQYQQGFMSSSGGGDYKNNSSHYLNYQITYRLELATGKRTSFFVQPTFNHVLQANEDLKAPFGIKSYRAGLGFGLLYRF